jgi:ATP-dependent Clp protease ATP-binding subunit ClpX
VKRAGADEALRCSFCHKGQDAVGALISSPSDYPRAYICDECIAVCRCILEEEKSDSAAAVGHPVRLSDLDRER